MSFPIVLRNPPINTRIKWFCDKRSGHVEEARNEIKHRFAYLDWSQQKKIIIAFLSSNKKDRQWIYSQMFDIWDDSFSLVDVTTIMYVVVLPVMRISLLMKTDCRHRICLLPM